MWILFLAFSGEITRIVPVNFGLKWSYSIFPNALLLKAFINFSLSSSLTITSKSSSHGIMSWKKYDPSLITIILASSILCNKSDFSTVHCSILQYAHYKLFNASNTEYSNQALAPVLSRFCGSLWPHLTIVS